MCLVSCGNSDAEVCYEFGTHVGKVVNGELIQRIITQDEFNSCLSAANNNDAYSQRVLGSLYSSGVNGVERDPDESVKWYIKAINNGDKESLKMLLVDIIYKNQDFDQALAIVKKGGEIGLLSPSEVQKYNEDISSYRNDMLMIRTTNTQSY
jgi:TPR repeat protein